MCVWSFHDIYSESWNQKYQKVVSKEKFTSYVFCMEALLAFHSIWQNVFVTTIVSSLFYYLLRKSPIHTITIERNLSKIRNSTCHNILFPTFEQPRYTYNITDTKISPFLLHTHLSQVKVAIFRKTAFVQTKSFSGFNELNFVDVWHVDVMKLFQRRKLQLLVSIFIN